MALGRSQVREQWLADAPAHPTRKEGARREPRSDAVVDADHAGMFGAVRAAVEDAVVFGAVMFVAGLYYFFRKPA